MYCTGYLQGSHMAHSLRRVNIRKNISISISRHMTICRISPFPSPPIPPSLSSPPTPTPPPTPPPTTPPPPLFLRRQRELPFLPTHLVHLVEPVAQLDDTKLDHSRVEPQGRPDDLLRLSRRVEAHDEVVSKVVCRLMFFRPCRKQQCAPVCIPPHNPAGV